MKTLGVSLARDDHGGYLADVSDGEAHATGTAPTPELAVSKAVRELSLTWNLEDLF